MTVLVGGVGHLYQGDLDLGRRAAQILAGEDLGEDVAVEDLYYGAVAVAQTLQDLRPSAIVLVGAEVRGRAPGSVERRSIRATPASDEQTAAAVREAATGYVSIDLVVEVAAGLGALPPRAVVVEVEPARVAPSESLSPEAERALERALELVRVEVADARRAVEWRR